MRELGLLFRTRFQAIRNELIILLKEGKLKGAVILFGAVGFWFSLFMVFSGGFRYLAYFTDIGEWIMIYMFNLFFFALTLMLIVSTAIINFSSLYKSAESSFLIPFPLHTTSLFFYKFAESITFSSWAFFFISTPLMVAYGVTQGVGWFFYPASFLLFMIFILIPAGLGTLLSIILATFFPRRRKHFIILLIIIAVVVTLIIVSQLLGLRGIAQPFTARWMQGFLYKLSFVQNPLLPSYWLARVMFGLSPFNISGVAFFGLLILAYALFIPLVAYYFIRQWYLSGYSALQSSGRQRKYITRSFFLGLLKRLLSIPLGPLIIKDLKSFWRDPVQWTQFLIFFGLLGVYFLNLRNLPYIQLTEYFWQYIVSLLNLIATSLTLATFTTRFIYPQMSLEGRRLWIVGLMPLRRQTLFYAKFLMGFISTLVVSELLIIVSTHMLEVPFVIAFSQVYTVAIICLGLSALAVGLGAVYPNIKEDNPSKIVAGFGGTLTLVLSMCYVLLVVMVTALPCHLYYVYRNISFHTLTAGLIIAQGVITILAVVVVMLILSMGVRAVARMEI